MSGKVRIRCGAKSCGVSFEVDRESIKHDKYIQCPMCSWHDGNEYFEGELDKSLMDEEKRKGSGVRESKNPLSKRLREAVFQLQVMNKWSKRQIAQEMGFDGSEIKPEGYLSLLLNNFDKNWPKTKPAQNRILEKIKKGEELIGSPILSNNDSDGQKEVSKNGV